MVLPAAISRMARLYSWTTWRRMSRSSATRMRECDSRMRRKSPASTETCWRVSPTKRTRAPVFSATRSRLPPSWFDCRPASSTISTALRSRSTSLLTRLIEKVADSGGRSESVTFEDLGCRGGWSEVVDGLARDFQGTGDFAQAGGLARAGETTDSAHLIGTGKCLKHDPALLVRLKLESNPFDGTEGLPVILGAIDKANGPAFQAPGLPGLSTVG